tara:strand:+ start:701 stop:1024 length:324 start_codon:yes stop_codon:yes gene_type:complete
MKIKKFKILILIGVSSLFLFSCNTVKKAFDPERKNSSEEFLVEKKMPLSMPPDFDELPIPQNDNVKKEDKDIKLLISDKEKSTNKIYKNESLNKDFEEFMLDKIKNN